MKKKLMAKLAALQNQLEACEDKNSVEAQKLAMQIEIIQEELDALEDNDEDDEEAKRKQEEDDAKKKRDSKKELTPEEIAALPVAEQVEYLVSERLKPIKGKLDESFRQRDEYKKKIDEMSKAQQKAQLEALRKEGREADALKMELETARRELEAANQRITGLTRDNELNGALGSLTFRNARSRTIAFKELSPQFKADASGIWRDADGKTIAQAVESFKNDEENAFLFEPIRNSGTGTAAPAKGDKKQTGNSLFALSTDALLKNAAKSLKDQGFSL